MQNRPRFPVRQQNARLLTLVRPAQPCAQYVWLLAAGSGALTGMTRSESIFAVCQVHRALLAASTPLARMSARFARRGELPGEFYEVTAQGLIMLRPRDIPEHVSRAFGAALMSVEL